MSTEQQPQNGSDALTIALAKADLAEGSVCQLMSMWHGELAPLPPAVVVDVVQARLAKPEFGRFLKAPTSTPAATEGAAPALDLSKPGHAAIDRYNRQVEAQQKAGLAPAQGLRPLSQA
jgi:hypothetical protein